MSKNTVTVAAVNGKVVVASGGEAGWGYARVESNQAEFSETGILNMRKRSALVRGKLENLEALGWVEGQALPGKIVNIDQFTPLNPMNLDQGLVRRGEGGDIVTSEGKKVYRASYYDATGLKQDVKFTYDPVEGSLSEATASEDEDAMGM